MARSGGTFPRPYGPVSAVEGNTGDRQRKPTGVVEKRDGACAVGIRAESGAKGTICAGRNPSAWDVGDCRGAGA